MAVGPENDSPSNMNGCAAELRQYQLCKLVVRKRLVERMGDRENGFERARHRVDKFGVQCRRARQSDATFE
jgi:hypothetical protein